jgi:SnoaL-like domain
LAGNTLNRVFCETNGDRVLTDDKYACAEVIQSWGLFRDQDRWTELLDTFTPDGAIAVSWFRGPFREFVDRCRARDAARTGRSKHLLSPSLVRTSESRALAETSVIILVRQKIEGVSVDLTSNARLLDRLVRRGRVWKLVERTAVYERDRLDPVEPSPVFIEMMQRANFSRYPPQYRFMAYRIAAAGGALAAPIHCDGMEETEAVRARYVKWLAKDAESSRGSL